LHHNRRRNPMLFRNRIHLIMSILFTHLGLTPSLSAAEILLGKKIENGPLSTITVICQLIAQYLGPINQEGTITFDRGCDLATTKYPQCAFIVTDDGFLRYREHMHPQYLDRTQNNPVHLSPPQVNNNHALWQVGNILSKSCRQFQTPWPAAIKGWGTSGNTIISSSDEEGLTLHWFDPTAPESQKNLPLNITGEGACISNNDATVMIYRKIHQPLFRMTIQMELFTKHGATYQPQKTQETHELGTVFDVTLSQDGRFVGLKSQPLKDDFARIYTLGDLTQAESVAAFSSGKFCDSPQEAWFRRDPQIQGLLWTILTASNNRSQLSIRTFNTRNRSVTETHLNTTPAFIPTCEVYRSVDGNYAYLNGNFSPSSWFAICPALLPFNSFDVVRAFLLYDERNLKQRAARTHKKPPIKPASSSSTK